MTVCQIQLNGRCDFREILPHHQSRPLAGLRPRRVNVHHPDPGHLGGGGGHDLAVGVGHSAQELIQGQWAVVSETASHTKFVFLIDMHVSYFLFHSTLSTH